MKNKWVAFLLCLFFGVIGAHRFYEGRILLGILYVLTGGLFGIELAKKEWEQYSGETLAVCFAPEALLLLKE